MLHRSVLLGLAIAALGCGGDQPSGDPQSGTAAGVSLTGAGATFPDPIYKRWFGDYNRKTGTQINYQSIGSGGGVKQFTEGTVDFGATDSPMKDDQITAVQGNVAHIPTVMGAVVLTYNLPGLGATRLKLDGPTIADIFLGKVTRWNDRRLTAANPGVALPNQDIIVVHRSDGSGTSFIFTDYLSKVSPEWKTRVGAAPSVNWPTGLGGKGNEGVTQQVKQSEASIGYVELIYAISNQLSYADVRNSAGTFVEPSMASVTAAAASATFAPDTDFRVSITDAPGANAYPISSFTWLLVKTDNPDEGKARTIKAFLEWMVTDEAQQTAATLHYAPLPAPVVTLIKERIGTLKAAGMPIA
jgi:phosphate transport system substrate-binding protein